MPPLLRRATDDDAGGVAVAVTAAWKSSYRGIVEDSFLDAMSVEGNAEHWRAYGPRSETWVWEDDGRIVGYVAIGPSRDADAPHGAGEVFALMVSPEAHGQGIGTKLLQRGVERLHERGFSPLLLWVLEDYANGRRFYENRGWMPDGATKSFPFGRPTPALRLQLSSDG